MINFGTDTIRHRKCPGQWLEIKTEMFRPLPLGTSSQVTTPYGQKVLGNLKQCSSVQNSNIVYISNKCALLKILKIQQDLY